MRTAAREPAAASEKLRHEMDRIPEEIDDLPRYGYRAEEDLDAVGWAGCEPRGSTCSGGISRYRIWLLKLRDNAVRNCYPQAGRDEDGVRQGKAGSRDAGLPESDGHRVRGVLPRDAGALAKG